MGQQGLPKGDRDAQQPESGLHGRCALSSCTTSRTHGHDLGEGAGQVVRRERGLGAELCSGLFVKGSYWEDGSPPCSLFLAPCLSHSCVHNAEHCVNKHKPLPAIMSR